MSSVDVAGATPDESVPRISTVVLWFALAGGVVAWMVHLVLGAAVVPAACEHDMPWLIDALTVVTAALCVAAAIVSLRILRRFRGAEDPRRQGYRILGLVALISNIGSLTLVIGEGLMHVWIGVCQ